MTPNFVAPASGGTPRKLMESGSYPARCYSMIDIGIVEEEYQGEKKSQHKIRLAWEFPTEMGVFNSDKGEEPYVLGKEYTFSTHEKATLRKDLEAWRGQTFTDEEARDFNVGVLLGKECLIGVGVHTTASGKTVNKIMTLGRMPKGMVCPPAINKTQALWWGGFDHSLFNSLPQFIQDKVKSSQQYKAMMNPHPEPVSQAPAVPPIKDASQASFGNDNFEDDSEPPF